MDIICLENNFQHVKTGENTILIIKIILTEFSPLTNIGHHFFSSAYKIMRQLLSDGHTSYDGFLFKFVARIDSLTKLYTTSRKKENYRINKKNIYSSKML